MASPDVRVRLTAEGLQEVVSALRTVASEAQKTGQAAARGPAQAVAGAFQPLTAALGGVRTLLATLGVSIGLARLTQLEREALASALAIEELASQTGTTVDRASGLSVAAHLAGIEVGKIPVLMSAIAKAVDELKRGDSGAVGLFRRLGLEARDFASDDTALHIEAVTRALNRIPDGATKAAIAMRIAARSGRDLLELSQELDRLGGLGGAQARARTLGVFVDAKTAAQLKELKNAYAAVGLEIQGAGLQLLKGFGPQAVQALRLLTGATDDTASALQRIGSVFGFLLRPALAFVSVVGTALTATLDAAVLQLQTIAAAAELVSRRQFRAAAEVVKAGYTGIALIAKQAGDRIQKTWEDLIHPPEVPALELPTLRGLPDEADNRAAARQKAIEDELRLEQQRLKLLDDLDKAAFEAGTLTLAQYLANRAERLQQAFDNELAAIQQQRDELARVQDLTPAERRDRGRELDVKEQEAAIRLAAENLKLTEEERQLREKLADQLRAANRELFDAEERRHRKAMDDIETERKAREVGFRQAGEEPVVAAAHAEIGAQVALAREAFDHEKALADAALEDYERRRSTIEQGQQGELERTRQLMELDRERLGPLQAAADELVRMANAMKDPDLIASAERFAQSLHRAAARAKDLADRLGDAIRSELATFLGSTINQVKDLADAFQQLGLAILGAIQQILALEIATAIVKSFGIGLAKGGKVERKAAGGRVEGPGGPTSDTIPAWLSPGEFVVRASEVARPGVLSALETLNRGGYPPAFQMLAERGLPNATTGATVREMEHAFASLNLRLRSMEDLTRVPAHPFAAGGLVGGPEIVASRTEVGGTIRIAAEPGSRVVDIRTPEGQRVLLEVLGKNSRAVRQVTGG